MKINSQLLAIMAIATVLPTFCSCDTSIEPEGPDQPTNSDTIAEMPDKTEPIQDTVCLPGSGTLPADSTKTGIISDSFGCPGCGMG